MKLPAVEPDFVGGLKAVRDKLGPVKKSVLALMELSIGIVDLSKNLCQGHHEKCRPHQVFKTFVSQ